MSIYPTKSYPISKGLSEFDILAASHKFLRDEENNDESNTTREGEPSTTHDGSKTWEEKLAEKYYENLFREFAICDLKHYKTGNFALRWRTESEVISGAGETTCGNTRCKHHSPSPSSFSTSFTKKRKKEPRLTTLELPFAYIEHGEPKNALVKVVLCPRCVKKLMWKRMKEQEVKEAGDNSMLGRNGEEEGVSGGKGESEDEENEVKVVKNKGKEREREGKTEKEARHPSSAQDSVDAEHRSRRYQQRERHSRRRTSRSRSPHHSNSKSHNRTTHDHNKHSLYHK